MTPEDIATCLWEAIACVDAARYGRGWPVGQDQLIALARSFDHARLITPNPGGLTQFEPYIHLPIPKETP